jgi:REP element-mobilizing transposase RayT
MARPLRLEFAHALYHVTSRGDRREDIYADDQDRQAWLDVLAHVCERFNWTVHAYCLMSNHYHLVVETPDANLSAGMRQLNGVYTQMANRRHGRAGHVFQGRFKAIIVEKDEYLLELARYVVLNPVRAGMVADVAEWPWSSYAAMMAPARVADSAWLATDKLLAYFAPQANDRIDRATALARYADHVRAGVGLPSIWGGLRGQVYLGSDAFVSEMSALAKQHSAQLEIPKAQRRGPPKPVSDYLAENNNERNPALRAAYAGGGYTMAELAAHFRLHYTSVSRIVNSTVD